MTTSADVHPGTREREPGPAAARSALGPLLRPLLRPLGVFVASRVLVLLAAAAGALVAATAGREVLTGPWPAVDGTRSEAINGLLRWDSAWYVDIAEHGWSSVPTGADSARNAFFPLFPLLVRAVAHLPGLSPSAAGLLVATLAGAAATVLAWLLTARLADRAAADRAAAVFAFFPGSFTLSMAYSEGLFLALTAACLLALVDRRWVLAGVLAALATATRPTGVALVAACAWAALVAVRRRKEWRALAAPLLAPLGAVAFFAFLAVRTGDRLAWFTAQREAWHEHVDPLATPRRFGVLLSDLAGDARVLDANTVLPVLGTVVALVGLALLLRWRPPGPVVVYAVVALALALGSATIGTRPRMVLLALPLVLALGVVLRGSWHTAVLGLCAGASALLTVLTVSTIAATP